MYNGLIFFATGGLRFNSRSDDHMYTATSHGIEPMTYRQENNGKEKNVFIDTMLGIL